MCAKTTFVFIQQSCTYFFLNFFVFFSIFVPFSNISAFSPIFVSFSSTFLSLDFFLLQVFFLILQHFSLFRCYSMMYSCLQAKSIATSLMFSVLYVHVPFYLFRRALFLEITHMNSIFCEMKGRTHNFRHATNVFHFIVSNSSSSQKMTMQNVHKCLFMSWCIF